MPLFCHFLAAIGHQNAAMLHQKQPLNMLSDFCEDQTKHSQLIAVLVKMAMPTTIDLHMVDILF